MGYHYIGVLSWLPIGAYKFVCNKIFSVVIPFQEAVTDVPVILVGNKTDQWGDRMVTLEEGQRRSKEIGCVCFHEISVRESIEQVLSCSVLTPIILLSS
jgi:GTPase SAR1 family protein